MFRQVYRKFTSDDLKKDELLITSPIQRINLVKNENQSLFQKSIIILDELLFNVKLTDNPFISCPINLFFVSGHQGLLHSP